MKLSKVQVLNRAAKLGSRLSVDFTDKSVTIEDKYDNILFCKGLNDDGTLSVGKQLKRMLGYKVK